MNDERRNRKNLDKLIEIAREPVIEKLEKAVRENVTLKEVIVQLEIVMEAAEVACSHLKSKPAEPDCYLIEKHWAIELIRTLDKATDEIRKAKEQKDDSRNRDHAG